MLLIMMMMMIIIIFIYLFFILLYFFYFCFSFRTDHEDPCLMLLFTVRPFRALHVRHLFPLSTGIKQSIERQWRQS